MTPRLPIVDVLRTLALLAMAVFHFSFDLELFGHLPRGTTVTGIWWWWSRATAGSFLVLVGISLWLAHGRGIRWPAFWRRWGIIVAAAVAVSVGTYLAMGAPWVRFGILHMIALGSLLALPFLRLPWWVAVACAVVVFLAPRHLTTEALNSDWLLWLGLGVNRPWMVDYLPILPWLAPVLAGVALAKVLPWHRVAWDSPLLRRFGWPGRHSLAIYLIHQPVLISLVWAFTTLT